MTRPKQMCVGKKRYDKRGAETVCKDRSKRSKWKMKIYACPHCDYWHLAKLNKRDHARNKI